MAPLLIGNIASAALDALGGSSSSQSSSPQDPFNSLISQLQQSGSGEKTVTHADGSSVTTVPTAQGGERIVSETSPDGQTLTQSGHVSPVQLHTFLNNLFSTLKSDGATVVNGAARPDSLDGAVKKLDGQLTTGSAGTQHLVSSFSDLMQGSGISLPAGTNAGTALKSFLANAAPSIESGQITRSGINLRS